MHSLVALAVATVLVIPRAALAGFAPGEETVFDVTYLRLRTGEARILVGRPEGQVWPVVFQARTMGVAGLLDIRENLVSYWDEAAQNSRGSDLTAYEVGDLHLDSMRIDRVNGTATVTVKRRDRKSVDKIEVAPNVQELTSAFMWLRLRPLEVGQRYEVPIISGTTRSTLIAEVMGKETVRTTAGTYPTVRLSITMSISGKFSTSRASSMWMSDDPRHLLVKASADFAIGSMVLELKRYTPGAAVTADAR